MSFRRVPADLDRNKLEAFAARLKQAVAPALDFHCLITTDAELRRLNAQFLGKNYPTDVLSFPESNDIAISYPRAEAQAREFGHRTEEEIRVLILHGVLHLLGMDHETDGGLMARAEGKWRAKLGLPSSLIARSRALGFASNRK
ncbi:MAG: rRNA maturation RNase YbeY [Acidobacteriota bacterium]|nr:rRNA maturation RNase YbeY [Acidobacteriota bacterium]